MRDPKRIKTICKLLEKLWLQVPDQRLGQLLSNYIYGHSVDIFYNEDDLVLNKLKGLLKELKNEDKIAYSGSKKGGYWRLAN